MATEAIQPLFWLHIFNGVLGVAVVLVASIVYSYFERTSLSDAFKLMGVAFFFFIIHAFAASYGTPVSVDDTLLGAAGDLHIATTGAITIGGTPADNDLIIFRIGRDPDNANDTATEDAVLVGVKFKYTSDALNDA